jgi:hypothetical protein
MNIKKSQLASVIKQVVREAIKEREYTAILNEVSPPGKKSERMIQHIKQSLHDTHPDWNEDKITSVAIATAWKNYDKNRVDEISHDNNAELDNITRLVIRKGVSDQSKVAYLVSNLFKHQTGRNADPEEVEASIERITPTGGSAELSMGSLEEDAYKVVSPNAIDTSKEDKARTIQTDPEVNETKDWIQKAVNPDHKGYCTPMSKSTCTPRRKALAMRFKKGDIHHDNEMKEITAAVDEAKDWIKKAINPDHKGYCSPMSKSTCTPKRKALAQRFKKGDIHHDNVDEASYKKVSPNSVDTAKEDKARTIQTEPEVNETAYKVQGHSYKTFDDSPKGDTNYKDDPENA